MRPEHYNYFRDYDPAIGRYMEPDPVGAVLYQSLARRSMGPWAKPNPAAHPRFSRPRPALNPLYGYASANSLARTDPLGLLDGSGGGGGNDPPPCPLVAELFMGWAASGIFNLWMCVYDCNTTCPASWDKFKIEIQWNMLPWFGCYHTTSRT